mmetsp:Transcript_2304/g.6414  ORF Transcript_2304/g.6414 Transcript_2304/m.6414 type:complete len:255 (-) Transcript_2304:583-1347(-)
MIATTSSRASSLFHILPPSRTSGGMEASMITSLGTCRLVIPLDESTIASPGRVSYAALMSASISSRSAASCRLATRACRSARPLLELTPSFSKVAPCLANTSLKNTSTAWPKIMGSEIFIIVALRWRDAMMPSSLQRVNSASKKSRRAWALMQEASITSPFTRAGPSLRTVSLPASSTCTMRTLPSLLKVVDFSLPKKSLPAMLATRVRASLLHSRIRTGGRVRWAYFFTGAATRRSELPSRSTGFTALPSTLA